MLSPMTTLDVSKSLSALKQSCTLDLDGLDGRILQLACPVIAETLTYLYNLCIDKNCFPYIFLYINLATLLIHLTTGLYQSYLCCQNPLKT